MENLPFDEKTMRSFKDIKEAIKVYSGQGIPTRRIVFLFNDSFEVRLNNLSINANFVNTESGQKVLEKYVGKSRSREIEFKKAFDQWKNKFKEVRSKKSISADKTIISGTIESKSTISISE
jgi:hypothetical protein